MSKRTVFTTITPLPPGVTRHHVLSTLHNHVEMIDLNPLVEERHPIKPPPKATPEEFHCIWYLVTDRVSYLPGGIATSKISYPACFHDLANGIQTHIYAPMGLEIRGKWTLGGSLPGEPAAPVEMGIGVPMTGLYVREDVDMRCNILMTGFVKKTLKKAHAQLVQRLSVKAQIEGVKLQNETSLAGPAGPSGSDGGVPSHAGSDYGGQALGSPAFSPQMGLADAKASPFVTQPSPMQPSPMQQAYMGPRQNIQSQQSPMGCPLPSPSLGGSMQHQRQGSYGQQQFVSELPGHGKGKEVQSPIEMPANEAPYSK